MKNSAPWEPKSSALMTEDDQTKRIVIKFGSGVLTLDTGDHLQIDRNVVYRAASEMAEIVSNGGQVIVVSSGAIALGIEEQELTERPKALADVQAMAAVGQSLLMALWREAFARKQLRVGQVLLTHSDLSDRNRYLNVRATLESLLSYGVVPVVNENDTVMTDEITVGDNDNLATQVAKLIGADTLALLSTVDGVLDKTGSVIKKIGFEDNLDSLMIGGPSKTGRGGMDSKIASARAAAHGGISVTIANGKLAGTIKRIALRQPVGTFIEAEDNKLGTRKHWIAYTLKAKGIITVDKGAESAIVHSGASILPVGIIGVSGIFDAGELIFIHNENGDEIARGLTRFSSQDIDKHMGDKGEPVIHRDDMVTAIER